MNSLDAYFLSVADKHHGHEPDFIESLFETSFMGDVYVDERGRPIWRKPGTTEHDLPDSPDAPSGPSARSSPTAQPKEKVTMSAATARAAMASGFVQKPATNTAPDVPMKSALSTVRRGKFEAPHRLTLYGPEGIGKSSFAAGAPNPIFLPIENGTKHLDVARFFGDRSVPKAESWAEARGAVRELINEKHEFKTLVIDTLDALEALLWRHMCERDKVTDDKARTPLKDIESYGFGKGYNKALEDWRALLKDLEILNGKGVHIVLLAHSQVRNFKNPAGEDYERYELALHTKASGLIKGWCDSVLFANYETFAKKDDRTKRVKAFDSGARLIFTERRAAYDAKHRGNLPESLPLSWADFEAESAKEVDPKALAAEILRKATELGDEVAKLVAATVEKAGSNTQQLIQINNRVNTRLAEKQAQEEEN